MSAPDVSRETLLGLLAQQTEGPNLDYKETLDLGTTRGFVEVTKDIGALMDRGGHIVIGADSHGVPTGGLSPADVRVFDEANLRGKLRKFIAEPFEIFTSVHERDGITMGVIHVPPHPSGCCVFAADGQYADAISPKKTVTVFRQGDVFVRHGSRSERAEQHDMDRILAKRVASAAKISWRLTESDFEAAVNDAFRKEESIALRQLVGEAIDDARRLLDDGDDDGLRQLLDRLTCLGALAVRLEIDDWVVRVAKALVRIYELGLTEHGGQRAGLVPSSTRLWMLVVARLLGIGAVAVGQELWGVIPSLVLLTPNRRPFSDGLYTNVARHAMVEGSRAGHLKMEVAPGQVAEMSFLRALLLDTKDVRCLNPDAPADEHFTNLLAQFDAIATVTVWGLAPGDKEYPYWPSYGDYNYARYEPAFVSVIQDRSLRDVVYPHDDENLARLLVMLEDQVRKHCVRFDGGYPYVDPAITAFLARLGLR